MNYNPEVDAFLQQKPYPMIREINQVRDIILDAHPQMQECVKWNSPTFTYKGNMASYFMNAKNHVSLMFHKGAILEDPSGLLEGDGKEARTARFYDSVDIEKKRDALISVTREWVKLMEESALKKSSKNK